jgi:hypothetical protein
MNSLDEWQVCNTCKESTSLSDYSTDRSQKNGKARRCRACTAVATQAFRDRNRDRVRQEANARALEWRKTDAYHDQRIRRMYGITLEQYRAEVRSTGGKCPICRMVDLPATRPAKHAHIDHCHRTGKFRGVICAKCNWSLGNNNDSAARLVSAARYLTKFRAVEVVDQIEAGLSDAEALNIHKLISDDLYRIASIFRRGG